MKKIFNRYLITKEELNKFHHDRRLYEEIKDTIDDNAIEIERVRLEKEEYAKYIGKWFIMDDGYIIKVERVRYKGRWGHSWDKYCLEASMPNMEDWMDISFSDIKDLEEISQEEAKQRLVGGAE